MIQPISPPVAVVLCSRCVILKINFEERDYQWLDGVKVLCVPDRAQASETDANHNVRENNIRVETNL